MDNFITKIIGVLFIVWICFMALIIVDFVEIDSLKKANEQLKKEKYECKQELDKYKEKYLDVVVRGE